MPSHDDISKSIVEFLDDYSIEVTPHDAEKFDVIAAELRPGTAVYVAHPPGMSLDQVVEFSGEIQRRGYEAVPHIIARKLESREQLDKGLAKLDTLGVHRALCIAGDIAVPDNAFESSLEVLETGLFSERGFRQVNVAGHPEGSKAIGDERAQQFLLDKAKFAAGADFELHITTQFGFNPKAFTDWEASTTAAGVSLPIHVGMAGPASIRQLAKFAMLCGIGSSARMLMTRTGATANLLKTQAPDEMITHIARHRVSHPETRMRKAHFFAFGGVAKAARWVNTVHSGRFVLNEQGTGFETEKQ